MLNQERWQEIQDKKLYRGAGQGVDKACVMQMVAYISGDNWTDSPECACPVLTRYAIYLNDKFNDEHRQKMKAFIVPLVGTRMNDETQIARKRMIMFRYVTVTYPLLLDLWKLPELATEFSELPNSIDGMAKAKGLLAANKSKIYEAAKNANANAYAYAYANAYANADPDADAYVYAYADADAYVYAYADAYVYAYAYAYVYAYADANAVREKIVESALETLRLAIEIKIGEASVAEPRLDT